MSARAQTRRVPARQDPGSPFRILLTADFSGAPIPRGSIAKPVRVDLDNVEGVFARFSARLELPWGKEKILLQPRSLNDFHPDTLFQAGYFNRLRELRERLQNPQYFQSALADLHALTGDVPTPHETAPQSPAPSNEPEDKMFERLLGRPRSTPEPSSVPAAVQALLREAVAPNVAGANAVEQQAAIAALDDIIAGQMNLILHASAFQALEAAWRGVDFLARRLELDETLQLYILDSPAASWRTTEGRNTWSEALVPREDEIGWGLLVADFAFGHAVEDCEMLSCLAEIAQRAGAPLMAGVNSTWLDEIYKGSRQPWPRWEAVRSRVSAKSLSLFTPRFMLRLPYGAKTDPIESFDFEEMRSPPTTANYLWGNSSLLGAFALAEAVANGDGDVSADEPREISGLPLHIYREDGEVRVMPSTERWLSDEDAGFLIQFGLSPVSARRGSDSVHVRPQNVAA